jgi:ribosome-binding ATPase YchF (GTP1/OBG family)
LLRELEWSDDERLMLKGLSLLTMKPMLYVVNVDEGQMQSGAWKEKVAGLKGHLVPICIKMESELASMTKEEAVEYLQAMGVTESGLDRLIKESYSLLGLITFLTSGADEARAWTITRGSKAPQAAGRIHTDFEKNFIRVEVTNWKDYLENGGEAGCRAKALTRVEGKDYVMQDGDVCYFRIGA